MERFGTLDDSGTIRFERMLPGPTDRVWSYLVDSEKRGTWFSSGEMEPRVGGHVTFEFDHSRLAPEDEPIPEKYRELEDGTTSHGEITEWDPHHLLSFDWEEETGESSTVHVRLTPVGEQVRLILEHEGLPDDREILVSVLAGWHNHLGILEKRLRGETPEGFWSVHVELEKTYAGRLAQE